MGKRKKDEGQSGEVAVEAAGPDLSLVMSLSLLAGGVATWPALQDVMDGKAAPVRAATLFLVATLVALIGFGMVALLFHSFAADRGMDAAAAGAGSIEGATDDGGHPVTAGVDLETSLGQQHEIDAALAPTEGLVHHQTSAP